MKENIIINPIKIVNLMVNVKKILGIIFLVAGIPIVLYSGLAVYFALAMGSLFIRLAEPDPFYIFVVFSLAAGIAILVGGIVLLVLGRKKG